MPRRILFVDNSEIVRRLIRTCLETRLECLVCGEAMYCLDAAQIARELAPDVIVLGLSMPQMNGLEAAAVLRSMLLRVPIVLFTLHQDTVSEKRAQAVGIRAVVSNSDRIEVLPELILNFVGGVKGVTG